MADTERERHVRRSEDESELRGRAGRASGGEAVRVQGDLDGFAEPARATRRAKVGRVLAPVLAVVVYLVMPADAGEEARAVAAVGVLMAVSWITEALPLPATALLPIVLLPLSGAMTIEDVTAPYANDVIFLFLGGFVLALAMQRWGLHRRIALRTILLTGTRPVRLVGGFMLATGFMSMWVSNTATAVMMLPIGTSVLALVLRRAAEDDDVDIDLTVDEDGEVDASESASPFATCLMLAIAYAASIGSLATIIGTPPNTFLAAFVEQQFDISIGFGAWMVLGLPLAAVFLLLTWLVLTRWLYRPEIDRIPGGRELIHSELDDLGPMERGERLVLGVFVVTALTWILRQPITESAWLTGLVPPLAELSDAGIAIAAAVVLFALPVRLRDGVFVLDWDTAKQLPWGVLLLFGGGLALAAAVQASGLDAYIGESVGGLGGLPTVVLVAAVVIVVILLTELTSNTATAATFLPILGGIGTGLGLEPLTLVVPAALAASCAFMMPVATPPNAIVFGSGQVTIPQMVRAGVWLNLAGVVLITLAATTLLPVLQA